MQINVMPDVDTILLNKILTNNIHQDNRLCHHLLSAEFHQPMPSVVLCFKQSAGISFLFMKKLSVPLVLPPIHYAKHVNLLVEDVLHASQYHGSFMY